METGLTPTEALRRADELAQNLARTNAYLRQTRTIAKELLEALDCLIAGEALYREMDDPTHWIGAAHIAVARAKAFGIDN